MEFKTCEQKALAELEGAEREIARLEDENLRLRERVDDLEKRVIDLGQQAHKLMVERDHHADCVKDMLATAKFYGFDQPQNVAQQLKLGEYNETAQLQAERDEWESRANHWSEEYIDARERIAKLEAKIARQDVEITQRDKGIARLKRQRDEARAANQG